MDKKVGDVVGYDGEKAKVKLIEDLKPGDKTYINEDKTGRRRDVEIVKIVGDTRAGKEVDFEVDKKVEIDDEVFVELTLGGGIEGMGTNQKEKKKKKNDGCT